MSHPYHTREVSGLRSIHGNKKHSKMNDISNPKTKQIIEAKLTRDFQQELPIHCVEDIPNVNLN